MKHITYGQKSLLIGDDAASALVAYAAAVARHRTGDHVTLLGYGANGDEIEATMVLSSGTDIISENVVSNLPELQNIEVVARMRDQTARLDAAPVAAESDSIDGDATLIDPY